MAAINYPLVVEQGSDYALRIPVLNESNDPVDVTDWTVRGQIRSSPGAVTLLHQLDVTPSDQYVELLISAADSSAWTWRTAVYSVELATPDDVTTRLIEGVVVVRPEITRA